MIPTSTPDASLLGLEGSVALVTGAGRGLAKAAAVMLARAGCSVSVVDIDTEAARETVREIETLGRPAMAAAHDTRDPSAVDAMINETIEGLGSLDVICNVVGNPAHQPKSFLDTTVDEWNAAIRQNLTTAFLCTRAAAIAMIERHIPGRIINVASTASLGRSPCGAGRFVQ